MCQLNHMVNKDAWEICILPCMVFLDFGKINHQQENNLCLQRHSCPDVCRLLRWSEYPTRKTCRKVFVFHTDMLDRLKKSLFHTVLDSIALMMWDQTDIAAKSQIHTITSDIKSIAKSQILTCKLLWRHQQQGWILDKEYMIDDDVGGDMIIIIDHPMDCAVTRHFNTGRNTVDGIASNGIASDELKCV